MAPLRVRGSARLVVVALGGFAIAGVIGFLVYPAPRNQQPTVDTPSPQPATPPPNREPPQSIVVTTPPVPVDSPRPVSPALSAFLDKTASDRIPPDLHVRLPSVVHPDDIAAVVALVRDRNDGDTERHEALSLLRRSAFPDLNALLWERLQDSEERERFRAFVVQHLGLSLAEIPIGAERITCGDRLYSCLSDHHRAVRREALLALVQADDARARQVVHAGLSDEAWRDSRNLIIRCAQTLGMTDLIPAIRPLAYEADIAIRIAALSALGEWKDEASREAFAEARRSDVLRIQRAGERAESLLAGRSGAGLVTPVSRLTPPVPQHTTPAPAGP